MSEDLRSHGIGALLILSVHVASWHALPKAVAETASADRGSTVDPNLEAQDPFWADVSAPLSAEDREAVAAAGCPLVVDGFEAWPSSGKWDVARMKPRERFAIQSEKRREGQGALAISLRRGDRANANGKHKHELWIANQKRCYFGAEVWYSFSFHVDGKYPQSGSTRWVIGQWKEESDGSPFLAQRFDNGVFHISIESGDKREIIATSPGDYNANFLFASEEFQASLPFARGAAPEGFDIMRKARDFGPGAFDVESLRRAIIDQDIEQFPFIADPESYGRIEGVSIEPSDDPILPSPTTDWVDMRYRVKGDRNGNGLIEVWANDRYIVRVTGKIGNDKFAGPTQYFKIGHYRDLDREFERSTLYVDRFKRSTIQSEVD